MKVALKELLLKVLTALNGVRPMKQVIYTATTASASPHGWSANITQSGWTPILYSLRYGNSGIVDIGVEGFTTTYIAGFCNYGGIAVTIYVLYQKA